MMKMKATKMAAVKTFKSHSLCFFCGHSISETGFRAGERSMALRVISLGQQ